MTNVTINAIKAALLFHPSNAQLSNADKAAYIQRLTGPSDEASA